LKTYGILLQLAHPFNVLHQPLQPPSPPPSPPPSQQQQLTFFAAHRTAAAICTVEFHD
jgi:hypothetical protein